MAIDGLELDEGEELPPHVEDTVRAIQKLHVEHHGRATPLERRAANVTSFIARPAFVGILTVLIALWIGGNLLTAKFHAAAFDTPPFPWLEDALTLTALYIALLILITQKRADTLAARREQLTLQIALLSEQKTAKVIALIEELRRDTPYIANRHDEEAEAMAAPVDHRTVAKVLESVVPDDGGEKARKTSPKK
jgi:uncharacterized membrane protein